MNTVEGRFCRALEQTVRQLGWDPVPVAPGDRPSREEADAYWAQLRERAPHPLFAIEIGQGLQSGQFEIGGLLVMSCETLGEALRTLVDYLPMFSETAAAELRHEDGRTMLLYQPHEHDFCPREMEMVLSSVVSLARWATGGRAGPERIEFRHAPADQEQRYTALLHCDVRFHRPFDGIVFHEKTLDVPLVQANPALRDRLRELADEKLGELGGESVSARVASMLQRQPDLSRDQVADRLGMSARHLGRCLADEGLTFRGIRDRVLEKLARNALARGRNVSTVAIDLGFNDESAFTKAYRRWTGVTPSEFQARR